MPKQTKPKKEKRTNHPGESLTSERRIEAKEKQAKALEMRKAGATFKMIAEKLEYADPSGAEKAVSAALTAIIQEPADALITLELERLDALFLTHYALARGGNMKATDRCLRIMERRAKLLGLDVAGAEGMQQPVGLQFDPADLTQDELETIFGIIKKAQAQKVIEI